MATLLAVRLTVWRILFALCSFQNIVMRIADCAPLVAGKNGALNLNRNPAAKNVLDYFGSWPGHKYHSGPATWSGVQWYQLMIDRFSDGDPTNNDGRFGGFYSFDPSFRQGTVLLVYATRHGPKSSDDES